MLRTSNQVGSGLKSALVLNQHKRQVEVETVRLLLECLVVEQRVSAIEERQVDQYLTPENVAKGLKEVVSKVLEERESEDTALTVDEEGPKDEEVSNGERHGRAL